MALLRDILHDATASNKRISNYSYRPHTHMNGYRYVAGEARAGGRLPKAVEGAI